MPSLLARLLRRPGRVGAPPFGHTPSPNYRWADLGGVVIYGINAGGDPREVSTANPLPTSSAAGALVALSSPPAALTANADTPLTFATPVRHPHVLNVSPTTKWIACDVPATNGTRIPLASGMLFTDDIPVAAIHIWSSAADPVNAAGGVMVWGYS